MDTGSLAKCSHTYYSTAQWIGQHRLVVQSSHSIRSKVNLGAYVYIAGLKSTVNRGTRVLRQYIDKPQMGARIWVGWCAISRSLSNGKEVLPKILYDRRRFERDIYATGRG